MSQRRRTLQGLARALAEVARDPPTIRRHADAQLLDPTLVRVPENGSARDRWDAVLERARLERRVENVVEGVLEENPAAEQLRSELADWLRETGAPTAGPPSDRAPHVDPVSPARLVAAGAGLFGLVLFLVLVLARTTNGKRPATTTTTTSAGATNPLFPPTLASPVHSIAAEKAAEQPRAMGGAATVPNSGLDGATPKRPRATGVTPRPSAKVAPAPVPSSKPACPCGVPPDCHVPDGTTQDAEKGILADCADYQGCVAEHACQ